MRASQLTGTTDNHLKHNRAFVSVLLKLLFCAPVLLLLLERYSRMNLIYIDCHSITWREVSGPV